MGHGVDICLSYNTAHSKKEARQNTGKQRGRAAQQKITDKVSCVIVLIVLKTN